MIIWSYNTGVISTHVSFALIAFYAFIFRTYLDGKRLVDKNVMVREDIWKLMIPGYRATYFKELYLK